jgi:phosphoglucosamine mutase
VDINGSATIQSAVSDAEQQLGQRGRVLLRPSGTEPLVRVMVEGEDEDEVQQVASRLAQVVEQEFTAA